MVRTTILPADPNKRKAWAAAVAEDAAKTQYFARMQGPEYWPQLPMTTRLRAGPPTQLREIFRLAPK